MSYQFMDICGERMGPVQVMNPVTWIQLEHQAVAVRNRLFGWGLDVNYDEASGLARTHTQTEGRVRCVMS